MTTDGHRSTPPQAGQGLRLGVHLWSSVFICGSRLMLPRQRVSASAMKRRSKLARASHAELPQGSQARTYCPNDEEGVVLAGEAHAAIVHIQIPRARRRDSGRIGGPIALADRRAEDGLVDARGTLAAIHDGLKFCK